MMADLLVGIQHEAETLLKLSLTRAVELLEVACHASETTDRAGHVEGHVIETKHRPVCVRREVQCPLWGVQELGHFDQLDPCLNAGLTG